MTFSWRKLSVFATRRTNRKGPAYGFSLQASPMHLSLWTHYGRGCHQFLAHVWWHIFEIDRTNWWRKWRSGHVSLVWVCWSLALVAHRHEQFPSWGVYVGLGPARLSLSPTTYAGWWEVAA